MLENPLMKLQLHFPPVPTVVVPMVVVPFSIATVLPTSPVPETVAINPKIEVRPVNTGALGASLSMATDSAPEAALTLPATSVALALRLCTPFAKVEAATVHFPPVATPVPITVVPSSKATVLPASAVPVKVGVATLVMLSVLDLPLSDVATRFWGVPEGRGPRHRC